MNKDDGKLKRGCHFYPGKNGDVLWVCTDAGPRLLDQSRFLNPKPKPQQPTPREPDAGAQGRGGSSE